MFAIGGSVKVRNTSKMDKLPVFCAILGGVLILTIILCGFRNGSEVRDIIQLCVFTGVVIMLLGIYFGVFGDDVRKIPYFKSIFITDLFLSMLFIVLADKRIPHSFLILGGLIVAILFENYLGMFVTNMLIVLAGVAEKIDSGYLICLMIIGTLLCFLASNVKKISTMPLVIMISASIQMILLIINDSFSFGTKTVATMLNEILVIVMIIPSATFIFLFYQFHLERKEILGRDKILESDKPIGLDQTLESGKNIEKNEANITEEYGLLEIMAADFPLLIQFSKEAPMIYEHALLVSETAGQAAQYVGLNEMLAKAGGLYYEVGKIKDGNYIQDGIQLALDYHLPKEIISIINSHNLKYAKLLSPEGAIINLTIGVLSARDFLKKNLEESRYHNVTERNRLTHKAIDELFSRRLRKNSLDESGLTIREYHKLKEFFMQLP